MPPLVIAGFRYREDKEDKSGYEQMAEIVTAWAEKWREDKKYRAAFVKDFTPFPVAGLTEGSGSPSTIFRVAPAVEAAVEAACKECGATMAEVLRVIVIEWHRANR